MFKLISMFVVGAGILLCDFLTKSAVYQSSNLPFVVFNNFLGIDFFINLAFNRGAAWGIFANFQTALLILRIGVILGMLVYLFLRKNPKIDFPLTLIIFGAIGNVIDYFCYGFVIDFLQFNLWGYHFPLFNIADSAITLGVVWLFISSFIYKKQQTDECSKTH